MIFWHSGTGNTLYVAEKLAELTAQPLGYISNAQDYAASKGEKIIWVFPVYSWGIPPVVKKYIKLAKAMPDTEHYMVCTCGDDVGLTHEMWRKLMRSKDIMPVVHGRCRCQTTMWCCRDLMLIRRK